MKKKWITFVLALVLSFGMTTSVMAAYNYDSDIGVQIFVESGAPDYEVIEYKGENCYSGDDLSWFANTYAGTNITWQDIKYSREFWFNLLQDGYVIPESGMQVTFIDENISADKTYLMIGIYWLEPVGEGAPYEIVAENMPITVSNGKISGITKLADLEDVFYIEINAAEPGTPEFGWLEKDNAKYWYENGIRQGTYSDANGVLGDGTVRGREIYDPESDGWYWLDAVYDGAKAVNKEVWIPYIYQNEADWDEAEIAANASNSGDMAQQVIREINNASGKWVRYDADGKMYKGWYTVEGQDAEIYPEQAGNTYYYDPQTGLMAKGNVEIAGQTYYFDEITGVLQK